MTKGGEEGEGVCEEKVEPIEQEFGLEITVSSKDSNQLIIIK